jgi:quinoprotein glucose dehydrogenase
MLNMTRLFQAAAAAMVPTGCGGHPGHTPSASAEPWEWSSYGGGPGSARHAPLADITAQSVEHLEVAWTYRPSDISDASGTWNGQRVHTRSSFEATPILSGRTLYVVSPFNRVIALDPETGAERWTFDPRIQRIGDYGDGFTSRGLAAWLDAAAVPGQPCRRSLFIATQGSRLIAIDAAGRGPCAAFGKNGEVRLDESVTQRSRGEYHMTSAPAVVGGTVIVGSAINDNGRAQMPGGAVRGYHARTGELRWSWNPIDPAPGLITGAANTWGPLSADPERGLVFVATGSASPDFYGGLRPGDNAHANSVVALDAASGKLVWSFQAVHHDLWDYDLASAPSALMIGRGPGAIPSMAQSSKMGHLFFPLRDNGAPVHPVEERPVPQNGVPGERLSPTQPFPVATPPFAANRLRPEDAWGLTPWDRAKCRELIQSLRNDGMFTPPSLEGSIAYPGNIGGTNWGGAAVDPERGIVVVNQTNLALQIKLIPREKGEQERRFQVDAEYSRQEGTPYIMRRRPREAREQTG